MHALYRITLCRGEDRSFPVTLVYRNPETGEREAIDVTDRRFLLTVRNEPEGEVLARLSTDDGSIVLGNMVNKEFIEAHEGERATTCLIQFTHDITEGLVGRKMAYDLFVISGRGPDELRQCVMAGELKAMASSCYG